MTNGDLDEEIRGKLVKMLGMANINGEARSYLKNLKNNIAVIGNLDKVEEKIKERFKRSDIKEEEEVRKEFCNIKLGANTSDTLDMMEILRTKIKRSLCKKKTGDVGEDLLDCWLWRDFIKKSKEAGRLTKYEFSEL